MPRVIDPVLDAANGPESGPGGTASGKKPQHRRRFRRPSQQRAAVTVTPKQDGKVDAILSNTTGTKAINGDECNDKINSKAKVSFANEPKLPCLKDAEDIIASNFQQHPLILDTRVLTTPSLSRGPSSSCQSSQLGLRICGEYETFIHELTKRGHPPSSITSTSPGLNNNNDPKSQVLVLRTEKADEFGLDPDSIALRKVPISSDHINDKSIGVPPGLSARATWKLFEKMVNQVVREELKDSSAKRKNKISSVMSCEITLITTDIAFFADTNNKNHAEAFSRFLKNLDKHRDKVKLVRIVIADTDCLALKGDEQGETDATRVDDDVDMKTETAQVELENHKRCSARCIYDLQAEIQKRLSSASDALVNNIDDIGCHKSSIVITSIDCSFAGFQSLTRQFVHSTTLANTTSYRLRFDLPETIDDSQCSLAFDMAYNITPFPYGTPNYAGLSGDLRRLSMSSIHAVQLIPLASLDASLIFGVPISVKASLEDNYEAYITMQILVRSVLKILSQREVALLLTVKDEENRDEERSRCLLAQNEQTFVLMAQEPTMSSQLPCKGLMFRYAQAWNVVEDYDTSRNLGFSLADPDTELQLTTYVDNAFDCFACDAFNPLYLKPHFPSSSAKATTASLDKTMEDV